jgi:Cu(I)/Ag(I) efflux system membrane fusion protein
MIRPTVMPVFHRARWIALAAVALALAVAAGCARGPQTSADAPDRAGEWRVGARNAPDPAQVGDNTLTVVVRDSSGRPLDGAVEMSAVMEAMGAMPRMESGGKVTRAGAGVFRVSYGLPMSGEWAVRLRLLPRNAPPCDVEYRVSTSIPGVAYQGEEDAAPGGAAPGAGAAGATAPTPGGEPAGVITLDATRRQTLGIRTEVVGLRELDVSLHTPGRVAVDEREQADVALKFAGWVRHLAANVSGQRVRRGDVLFTVYSPELWSAQQEYLGALKAAAADSARGVVGSGSAELANAAGDRLALWDFAPADIAAIARSGAPRAELPVRAPVSGVVLEKNVVAGSAFTAGQLLFRVARLDPVWVVASVRQEDLGGVREGARATIRDPYSNATPRNGRVMSIYPKLDDATRTADVRVAVANADGGLQPGRFVDVELASPAVRRVAVPEAAVLPTGERNVVFVDLGGGRLAPRDVRLGRRAAGYVEILEGLVAGDRIVTSGNFMVAAESQLRAADHSR